ncbi:DUF4283 domain-containing protein/zf-CCHC_4 domain-containing protein [Cephalotus follicularis]|uniref:DUF4283 domain-containing protein/zf-CCHC_4 domain-containing protein n=1 Tax=Cephalotus follicularis TaxID=3775 RepID=A0A1Q3DBZ4_CEPFO|nr:DUF4283 domain-containing protein/zf-CCHC_4 domain-containing protein [Cephalotus follicularis]
MSLTNPSCDKVPIWVKLHNLPLVMWTPECITCVASIFGNPMYMDQAAELISRLNYERVCIEMQASSSFPNSIPIDMGMGYKHWVNVEYTWKPSKCPLCNVFGHSNQACAKAPRKDRNPKDSGTSRIIAEGWIEVGSSSRQEKTKAVDGNVQNSALGQAFEINPIDPPLQAPLKPLPLCEICPPGQPLTQKITLYPPSPQPESTPRSPIPIPPTNPSLLTALIF